MNAELKETLELVRTLDSVIAFSEHHCPTMPVTLAAKRARESLIDCLRKAIADLANAWPNADPQELVELSLALERDEIPKAKGLPGYLPHLISDELAILEEKLTARKTKGNGKIAHAAGV